jgi:hypothetical protein
MTGNQQPRQQDFAVSMVGNYLVVRLTKVKQLISLDSASWAALDCPLLSLVCQSAGTFL